MSEGISKVGPALLSGPIFATFEKVSSLLPAAAETAPPTADAPAAEPAAEAAPAEAAAAPAEPAAKAEEETPKA